MKTRYMTIKSYFIREYDVNKNESLVKNSHSL